MTIKEEIIKYIKINRVSTTEVADCLGKTGVIPDVLPMNKQLFAVGEVFWVYAYNESNWDIHEQIRCVPENSIVLIEAFNCGERALIGELVSKYILLYRQAVAMVVIGKMRDAHKLIKDRYPIWCSGVSPVGCFNIKNTEPFDNEILLDRQKKYNGAIAVCDDSGVVIIPPECITWDFYQKLEFIEEQEDIWFECIDKRKWDTFDTVCLKKYKENQKEV